MFYESSTSGLELKFKQIYLRWTGVFWRVTVGDRQEVEICVGGGRLACLLFSGVNPSRKVGWRIIQWTIVIFGETANVWIFLNLSLYYILGELINYLNNLHCANKKHWPAGFEPRSFGWDSCILALRYRVIWSSTNKVNCFKPRNEYGTDTS